MGNVAQPPDVVTGGNGDDPWPVDPGWHERHKFVEKTFFQLLPRNWGICGDCECPTRPLTDEESRRFMSGLAELIMLHPDQHEEVWAALFDPVMTVHGARPFEYGWRRLCVCNVWPRPVPKDGFFVYWLWGADRRLLYIGASRGLEQRIRSHIQNYGDVIRNVTWTEHEDAASMFADEAEAINEHKPPLNKAGI